MADSETGTSMTYEALVNSLADNSLFQKTGFGDKLAEASSVLGKLSTTNLALQQFGFYKRLSSMLKDTAKESVEELKSQIAKPQVPLGTEGTELKDLAQARESIPSEELSRTEQGIGRSIPKETLDAPTEVAPISDPVSFQGLPEIRALRQFEAREQGLGDPNRPLFPEEEGLPSLDLESQAPLFLGQQSGEAGVIARGGQPQPEIEPAQPQAPAPVQEAGEAEDVVNADTAVQSITEETPQAFAEARVALNTLGGETQSIRGSLMSRFTDFYKQAQDLKTSVESGIARFQAVRNQANDVVSGLKEEANQKLAQGRQALQDAQDAVSRGEEGASDLVKQAQSQIDDAISSSENLDLVNDSVSKAQDFISRGNALLAQGKQEGISLLEQGQEQIKVAQSAVEGYAGQGRALAQTLQNELETRTTQINEFAEGLAQKAGEAVQTGKDIAGAVTSGDVEGATTAIQSGVKQLGKVAGDVGIEGGEEIGAGIAEAIPVVGEIVSAGLLISTLFTGLADEFKPHHPIPIVNQASIQYGL
jgi:hypothetical protein